MKDWSKGSLEIVVMFLIAEADVPAMKVLFCGVMVTVQE